VTLLLRLSLKTFLFFPQWRLQRGGKLPPYGWTSKNYVICVCFNCHGTSSYHTTNTKPYKFPMHCSKCVSFWGTSYSRRSSPIDPYLTSPLLQNPGGATVPPGFLSPLFSVARCLAPATLKLRPYRAMQLCLFIAKFHYTDTDPNGHARTQRSFAAKKSVSVSVSV